jgi:hypothetical protein
MTEKERQNEFARRVTKRYVEKMGWPLPAKPDEKVLEQIAAEVTKEMGKQQ